MTAYMGYTWLTRQSVLFEIASMVNHAPEYAGGGAVSPIPHPGLNMR